MDQLAVTNGVHGHGDVLRREDGHVWRRALQFEVKGQVEEKEANNTWKKQVEVGMEVGLSRYDALIRSNWIEGVNEIAIKLR